MDELLPQELASKENICIVDSGTTHTILKSKMHFSYLTLQDAVVHIISESAKLIEGSRRATIMLPCGTKGRHKQRTLFLKVSKKFVVL